MSPGEVQVSSGLLQGQGLWVASPGQGLLEEVTINPNTELPELTQDWGNRLLGGKNKNL